jgi:transcriptional regulator with XRE-family HTH domain
MAGREQAESVSAVFASNARALRTGAGLRTEEVAKAVTARGLRWVPSRVSELEMGRIAPTLATLLILSAAFTDLRGEPVVLADWFEGDGFVDLTETVQVPLAIVRAALNGVPVSLPESRVSFAEVLMQEYLEERVSPKSLSPARLKKLTVIWDQYGGAEDRAARALGIDQGTLCELMLDLWGTTLSAKRDELAGPDANSQKRGRIARELREQLRGAIANGERRKIRDV